MALTRARLQVIVGCCFGKKRHQRCILDCEIGGELWYIDMFSVSSWVNEEIFRVGSGAEESLDTSLDILQENSLGASDVDSSCTC